ncbi:hypothetical protein B0H19DRAFT_1259037 [Mycena capillaripes]|nr:hypothetical protein B0H19DRAFT_1259037 [Mycena capillaripes]
MPHRVWTPNIQLFDTDIVNLQRSSPNLVVFSPTLRIPVKVAWSAFAFVLFPMRKTAYLSSPRPTVNQRKIPPEHILSFLRSEDLHWACFCTLLNCTFTNPTESAPSTISTIVHVPAPVQGNFVVCGHTPARCSFFIDLGAVYDSTTLCREYIPGHRQHNLNTSWQLANYLNAGVGDNDERVFVAREVPEYWGEYGKGQQRALEDPYLLPALPALPPLTAGRSSPPPSLQYRAVGVQVDERTVSIIDLPELLGFSMLSRGAGITLEQFDALFGNSLDTNAERHPTQQQQDEQLAKVRNRANHLLWDASRRHQANPTPGTRYAVNTARSHLQALYNQNEGLLPESQSIRDSRRLREPDLPSLTDLAERRQQAKQRLANALLQHQNTPTFSTSHALDQARRDLLALSYQEDPVASESSSGDEYTSSSDEGPSSSDEQRASASGDTKEEEGTSAVSHDAAQLKAIPVFDLSVG